LLGGGIWETDCQSKDLCESPWAHPKGESTAKSQEKSHEKRKGREDSTLKRVIKETGKGLIDHKEKKGKMVH